jgi:hypothetical protein
LSDENVARASHDGYGRLGIVHQRTVQLSEHSLLLTDEVSGSGEHSVDLRFVLDPGWRATPVLQEGEAVSCVLDGPRWLAVVCEAESELKLSVEPTEISREYGAALPYPDPYQGVTARKNRDQDGMGMTA